MPFFNIPAPSHRLWVFRPPYRNCEPIGTDETLAPWVRGQSLVWYCQDVPELNTEFDFVFDRPPCYSLIVVVPLAEEITREIPAFQHLAVLSPTALLPRTRVASPKYFAECLVPATGRLPILVQHHLLRRRVIQDPKVAATVRRILELSAEVASVSELSRRIRISRRTLGRTFEAAGLPPASSWLRLGRILRVAIQLQRGQGTVFDLATRAYYPDGFTLSNQMKRLIDCRPSDMRDLRGWEWMLETWIRRECRLDKDGES
jgi:AraC-like DNA-binding protein